MKTDTTAYRPAALLALVTACLLMAPLLAMQVTNEVVWGPFDFAVAGTLLFGTGLMYQLAARNAANFAYRVAIAAALVSALLLVWVNLAVGVIGTENNPANLLYIGVLAVGIVGARIARMQPRGMARALFAMAFAQALVAVIAVIFRLGPPEDAPQKVLIVNGFFVALFVASAMLFLYAARKQSHDR